MAVRGCSKCLKYMLFTFNLIFWLVGCAVLGIGIWLRFDPKFHQYVDIDYLYTASYVLMGVGGAMIVVCFLGCCGSYKESQCMLAFFAFFMAAVFLAITVAIVVGYFKQDEVQELVDVSMNSAVDAYYRNGEPWAKSLMDAVQTNFGCCGGTMASMNYLTNVQNIPASCAFLNYSVPCTKAVYDFFVENFLIVVGVAAGVGVILILGIIFSCCLLCAVRRELYDPYDYPDKYDQ